MFITCVRIFSELKVLLRWKNVTFASASNYHVDPVAILSFHFLCLDESFCAAHNSWFASMFINFFLNFQAPIVPPRPQSSNVVALTLNIPTAYNDKVVAFLRQPNIFDILKERYQSVATNQLLRDKVNAVRVEGTAALDRLSDDIELTIVLRWVLKIFHS